MKHQRTTWSALTIGVFLLAVVAVTSLPGIAAGSSERLAGRPDRSTASVFTFADPEQPVGRSRLTRTNSRMWMKLRTSQMASRETATIWWVVFNEPEHCSAPGCGSDDIFVDGDPAAPLNEAQIAKADIVAAYATGKVASRTGRATFRAALREHEPAGTREIILGSGATLKDARGAEAHLVVRSHGPAMPGRVQEQIGSFAGGCDVDLVPPDAPAEVGECGDIMFAVHQP